MPGIRSLPPPSKRRKLDNDSKLLDAIKLLEADISRAISENGSLNPLADLIELMKGAKGANDTSKSVYALYRVFVLAIASDKLLLGGDEAAKLVKTWLWEQMHEFVDYLGGLLKDEEKSLRISAIQILMSLQKHLSSSYTKLTQTHPQFHISHFRKIVSYLLKCPPSHRAESGSSSKHHSIDADVLHEFYETWLSVHDDIRWFFLRESATLLNSSPSQPEVASNLLSFLERLTTFPTEQAELNSWWISELGAKPPKPKKAAKGADSDSEAEDPEPKTGDGDEDDDWRKFFEDDTPASETKPKTPTARLHTMTIHQSLHSLQSHRAVFTRTWLTLLPSLSLAEDSRALATRALNVMHRGVMPHLTRAILVMDWVGSAVDMGATVGLLALNALFILMKEYNLDYPSFYTRLYAFLDRDVLHLKHRARFFRMTELFLSSTHLPANLLASFVKRLSRLSLSAPPAAIIMIIPFTYNLLKRHPALMTMIHRSDVEEPYADPFLADEPNPLSTQAQYSSLWELVTHRSHYHSTVSTLAKIFSEAFTKPSYALEDFLDHTYSTLFDTEVNRKIKKEPALVVELGQMGLLFPVSAEGNGVVDSDIAVKRDVVSELWDVA